jgi:hypothetical protein
VYESASPKEDAEILILSEAPRVDDIPLRREESVRG